MSTPEFSFLQLAQTLTVPALALAGCALCAAYRIDEETGKLARRDPITSVERIGRFLSAADGCYGIGKARETLRYLSNGAESPLEQVLYLLVRLPKDLGGFGFEGAAFNHVMRLSAEQAGLADRPDRTEFRVDVWWRDQGVGLEYLGKQHDATAREDRERINALQALGGRILQVDHETIRTADGLLRLERQLGALLNVSYCKPTQRQRLARAELLELLLGAGRPIV